MAVYSDALGVIDAVCIAAPAAEVAGTDNGGHCNCCPRIVNAVGRVERDCAFAIACGVNGQGVGIKVKGGDDLPGFGHFDLARTRAATSFSIPIGKGGVVISCRRKSDCRAVIVNFSAVRSAINARRRTGHRAAAGTVRTHFEGVGVEREGGGNLPGLGHRNLTRARAATRPVPTGKGRVIIGYRRKRDRRAVIVSLCAVRSAVDARRRAADCAATRAVLVGVERGVGRGVIIKRLVNLDKTHTCDCAAASGIVN